MCAWRRLLPGSRRSVLGQLEQRAFGWLVLTGRRSTLSGFMYDDDDINQTKACPSPRPSPPSTQTHAHAPRLRLRGPR